jgi:hypothetical protein
VLGRLGVHGRLHASTAVVSRTLARSNLILVRRPILSAVGVSGRYPAAEIAQHARGQVGA